MPEQRATRTEASKVVTLVRLKSPIEGDGEGRGRDGSGIGWAQLARVMCHDGQATDRCTSFDRCFFVLITCSGRSVGTKLLPTRHTPTGSVERDLHTHKTHVWPEVEAKSGAGRNTPLDGFWVSCVFVYKGRFGSFQLYPRRG